MDTVDFKGTRERGGGGQVFCCNSFSFLFYITRVFFSYAPDLRRLALDLVDLLDGGSGSSTGTWGGSGTGESTSTSWESASTSWESSWGSSGGTSSRLVELGHDGVHDLLELGGLVVELLLGGGLVGIEPLDGLVDGLVDGGLVLSAQLVLEVVLLGGVAHGVGVVLELVLGLDAVLGLLVLLLVVLSLLDHLLDLVLGETSLLVGDGDLVLLSSGLVLSGDVEDTVGIDIEGNLDLGDTTGGGGDSGELELSEQVVVAGHGTLSFVDLDEHTGLVVGVGGEHLGLLAGNGAVTGDEGSHDSSGSLDTEGEGGHIEKQEVLDLLASLSGENGGLHGSSVGDGLIGVDGLVELLAVEEVLQELLNLGDTGGSSDQDDLVDGGLAELGVSQHLLDGLQASAEQINAELLEPGSGDVGVEVNTLVEGVDLDGSLGGGREGSLRALAGGTETADGSLVASDVLLELALELLHEVVHEAVVEVLTSQVSVSTGGLDLEHTGLDGEEGHIECTTSQVEDEHVLLSLGSLVETVGNSGGCGLVDDTEDVETRDGSSILGGLTLGVVEISGDCKISIRKLFAEEGECAKKCSEGIVSGDADCAVWKCYLPVITALVTVAPRKASAVSFILINTMAEISSGENSLDSPLKVTLMWGLSPSLATTLKGQCFMSSWQTGSENL